MQTPSPSTRQIAFQVLACGDAFPQGEIASAWQSKAFQDAVRAARERFGHALCLCRRQPLKLQIREREALCHLAVWPNEGPAHDTECVYFRDEVTDGEAARPADTAEPPSSTIQIPQPRSRIRYTLGMSASAGARPVSIRSLAIQFWERASLCRWHPTWTRDWGRTRYQLMLAAREMEFDGAAGENNLFVPRPYRESQQGALNAEWEQFTRELGVLRGSTRILIAPVRRFTPQTPQHPPVVHLRHLRAPIGLSPACHDFIVRECRNALRSDRLMKNSTTNDAAAPAAPEVIGFFLVEGSSRGGVWARAAWLLMVHPIAYIPTPNPSAVMLVDELLAQGYAFQHLLTDVQPSKREAADWLVRHVRGPDGIPASRAALEILDRGCSPEYLASRAAVAERMQRAGIPTWTWVPEGRRAARAVPPLPPADHVSPPVAAGALRQIQSNPSADYRYGASSKFSTEERKTA